MFVQIKRTKQCYNIPAKLLSSQKSLVHLGGRSSHRYRLPRQSVGSLSAFLARLSWTCLALATSRESRVRQRLHTAATSLSLTPRRTAAGRAAAGAGAALSAGRAGSLPPGARRGIHWGKEEGRLGDGAGCDQGHEYR